MVKPTDRRFPKVLGDQLVLAFRRLDRLGISGLQQDDLLQRARRDMLHALVNGCLNNPPTGEISAPRMSFLESELSSALANRTVTDRALIFDALWKLNDAFEALHRYRMPGGELDYVSTAVRTRVVSIKNSEARSKRTLTTEGDRQISTVLDHAQIAAFLERRGYNSLNHGTKKTAVIDAVDHFKSSEPSVRRVIRDYGLSKK